MANIPVISKIGPMVLLEVKRVLRREGYGHMVHYIIVGNKWRYAASGLNCFVAIRNGEEIKLKSDELQIGDLIWLDETTLTGRKL